MSVQRFEATVECAGNWVYLILPFDPNDIWGFKDKHHLTGSINDEHIRGFPEAHEDGYRFPIGAAWLRDHEIEVGDRVTVSLEPCGPQAETVAPDIAAALESDPDAKIFFESLAPFYRKNFIRDIEGAKRPETRSKRIAAMMNTLQARRKQ